MDLHGEIMNIPVSLIKMDGAVGRFKAGAGCLDTLYKEGHRDARHSAAELATTSDAKIEAMTKLLEEAHVSLDVCIAAFDLTENSEEILPYEKVARKEAKATLEKINKFLGEL